MQKEQMPSDSPLCFSWEEGKGRKAYWVHWHAVHRGSMQIFVKIIGGKNAMDILKE